MDNYNWKKITTKFLTAQTVSLFGSSLVQYAIIWYITLTTSSGVMMTIATLCGYIPQIGISLFAGVWIDRYDKKKMMMLSDAVIALSTLSIGILFLMGNTSIWFLFGVLVIRSAGTGIQTPAVNAFIPELVPKEHLMRVNGINSTLTSLTNFLAPAVSGALLGLISIEVTFFIDVVTAVIGIGIMFTIKSQIKIEHKEEQAESAISDIRLGFQYIKEHVYVKHQLIYLMVVAIFISPSAFLTPLLISRVFGSKVWMLTISEMVFSLGAVSGGMLIATWGGFRNRRHTVIAATLFYGIMMVGIGLSPFYFIYLLCNFLIGISMPCYNAPITVSLQEHVTPSMHGRVFSMVQIASACALPLGTIIFGPLADLVPVQTILIFTGLVVICFGTYAWKSRVFYTEG